MHNFVSGAFKGIFPGGGAYHFSFQGVVKTAWKPYILLLNGGAEPPVYASGLFLINLLFSWHFLNLILL